MVTWPPFALGVILATEAVPWPRPWPSGPSAPACFPCCTKAGPSRPLRPSGLCDCTPTGAGPGRAWGWGRLLEVEGARLSGRGQQRAPASPGAGRANVQALRAFPGAATPQPQKPRSGPQWPSPEHGPHLGGGRSPLLNPPCHGLLSAKLLMCAGWPGPRSTWGKYRCGRHSGPPATPGPLQGASGHHHICSQTPRLPRGPRQGDGGAVPALPSHRTSTVSPGCRARSSGLWAE